MRNVDDSMNARKNTTVPVSPTYSFSAKGQNAGGNMMSRFSTLADSMLDERNLARDVGADFSPSERRARIGSRRIQAQNKVAEMLAGLGRVGMQEAGQTTRTGMNNRATLQARSLAEAGQTQRTGMNNRTTLSNTALAGQNALSLADRRAGNLTALEEKKNTWGKEADNRRMVQTLAAAGVPIDETMTNAYNTTGDQMFDLTGEQVPREKQEKPVFAKPQYDKDTGALLEGSGQWYEPGQNVGELGMGSFTQNDFDTAMINLGGEDFDINNPTPEQVAYMRELGKTNPELLKYIQAQLTEQAQP